MPTKSWICRARVLAAACLLVCLDSYAQTDTPLLDTVQTIAAATTAVPVQETLKITTAGTYQINLTDLGAQSTPATPLASLKLAISSGDALVNLTAVGTATVNNQTQLVGAGSATFSAAQPGNYLIHVIGAPSLDSNSIPVVGSGPIAMQVTDSSGNPVQAFTDVLALPPSNVQTNVGTLNSSFTVPTSGNYTLTLTDMQLPAALTTLQAGIIVVGGSVVTPLTFGTSAGSPVATTTVALTAGTNYQIFAGGQAAGALNAGLYGLNLSLAGGSTATPVYSNTVAVGSVTAVGTPTLTATNYTATFADLSYPSALSQAGVVIAQNGLIVSQLSATGTSAAFTATATPYQVFALGVPASNSQGSYTLSLQPAAGGTPALSVAQAVADPASGYYAYSYNATTVGSETYSFDLADFGYPTSFAALKANAVQNGALLSPNGLTGAGSLSLTPAVGTVTLLVFAQPANGATASATAGLFGLDLIASGAATPALETSQGVGQLFSVQTVTVSTGGQYQVAVNDLGFPANFANLAVIITRGTSKIGSTFGGVTFPFTATAGNYTFNIVAQPTTTDLAGTYSIVVGQAPPAATLTLQASATSIASGGTVTLTWSSTNTSSCTAASSPSGAWSGSVATSGTATSAALTATTTFTLTCVGTDGTTPTQSVQVSINSTTKSSGGGGGGAIQEDVLALLLGLVTLRLFREKRS